MRVVQRNPGIDVLRAIAMFLGIFLHGAIPYKIFPHRNWIHDINTNLFFDFIYFIIHSFRMPVFFIIAGFFCNHLLVRYSIRDFIKNRLTRVGLPFFFSILLVIPFTLFPYTINKLMTSKGYTYFEAAGKGLSTFFSYKGLAHLWFLYDLLIFYSFVIVLKSFPLVKALFFRISMKLDVLFCRKYSLLWFSLPVFIFLVPGEDLYLITDTYLIPRRPLNLLFYGYLFYLGYLFYTLDNVLNKIILKNKSYLVLSIILLLLLFVYHIYVEGHTKDIFWYLIKIIVSIQIISGSLGLIGLFISQIKKESYYTRYLADASYWIYIIHLALILYLQVWFLQFDYSSYFKYFIIVSITIFISLTSYELLIRYSIIGNILHGKKNRSKSIGTVSRMKKIY